MSDNYFEEEIYYVEEGDTLESISEMCGIPANWIKEYNHIYSNTVYPGDRLRIVPPPDLIDIDPIEVEVFGEAETPKGIMKITNESVSFTPIGTRKARLINLIGHLESAVMPHPISMMNTSPDQMSNPDALGILLITHLENPSDTKSMKTSIFAGKNSSLTKMQIAILARANYVQSQNEYLHPDPNSIPCAVPEHKKSSESENPTTKTRQRSVYQLPPIKMNGETKILSAEDISKIRHSLPIRVRNQNWSLLFQLSRDGSSYSTFYELTAEAQPVLLVLTTHKGEKIGAYVSLGFKISRNFYGSGETFVFRFIPKFEVYKWAESNKYFTTCTKEEISIGGGQASAIWIDGTFLRAFSEGCPTFNSPGLTSEPQFSVVDLEVWKIGEVKDRLRK